MLSARRVALFAALCLALFLWLRPIVGRLGKPAPPEVRATRTPSSQAGEASPGGAAVPPMVAVSATHLDAVEVRVLELTNVERARKGLSALRPEETLREVARDHNVDMLQRGFWNHVNPDGEGPGDRVARSHRRLVGGAGENLWSGTGYATGDADALAQLIVDGWMGSAGHRRNILTEGYSHLGVGVSRDGDELRATQVFGELWGYLNASLQARIRRGGVLELGIEPARGRPAPERYDLFESAKGLAAWGPRPLADGRIDASPGKYQLRFHFPRDGGFRIVSGPGVEVTP